MPRLYEELAPWYTLITAPSDYVEEAAFYTACIEEHAAREVRRVLELGCGSGANASHMKARFEMVLVDLSPQMLEECARINPELPRHVGDMRTYRSDERFDAVFVHDAASYVRTADDVRQLCDTAMAHLEPGGVVLLCPDDLRENYTPGTDDGGHDGEDGRAARYFSWSVPGDDEDTVFTDYVYLLRSPDKSLRVEQDRHVTGRLPKATWLGALEAAGFADAKAVALEHSEVEAGSHHVLVAMRPA